MSEIEEYRIRPLTPDDQPLLWEMLYLSLHVPEGGEPFAREVVERPEIAKYVRDWGREGDAGFVAVDEEGRPIGAVWLRLLRGEERGFGYVDDRTPELGVAVLAGHRGRGVGTRLLARLVEAAACEFECVSLSVSAGNPARRLYERLGFEEVGTCGDSVTMRRRLKTT